MKWKGAKLIGLVEAGPPVVVFDLEQIPGRGPHTVGDRAIRVGKDQALTLLNTGDWVGFGKFQKVQVIRPAPNARPTAAQAILFRAARGEACD